MIAGMIIKIKYFDFFAFVPKSFNKLLLFIIGFLFIFPVRFAEIIRNVGLMRIPHFCELPYLLNFTI